MDYAAHCDYLEDEGARFVELSRRVDTSAAVPSCPEWRVSDLLAHVGAVHRWSTSLVKERAAHRISPRAMNLSRGPVTPQWLADGLGELLVTLRASDPDDAMWAWGEDQHVRYWARRQLHETLVHRIDLEAAQGVDSVVDPVVAADAIDEFFANIERAGAFSPDVKNLVGNEEVIKFIAVDGPTWTVRLDADNFQFLRDTPATDASLCGHPTELLTVIYRRRALDESSCVIEGRRDLVDKWIENSALL